MVTLGGRGLRVRDPENVSSEASPGAHMLDANDCYAVFARLASAYSVRPFMAVSRRSGDEIHPWPPNGGLRPLLAIRTYEANVCIWTPPLLQALCSLATRFDCSRISGLCFVPLSTRP